MTDAVSYSVTGWTRANAYGQPRTNAYHHPERFLNDDEDGP